MNTRARKVQKRTLFTGKKYSEYIVERQVNIFGFKFWICIWKSGGCCPTGWFFKNHNLEPAFQNVFRKEKEEYIE